VAVDNFGKPGVRPLLVYAVIAAGLGATAIALAWSIPIGVGLVVGGVWLARLTRRAERVDDYDRRAPVSPAGPMASEFWKFATPRAFASVFATIVAWVATLMLGALQGTKEAGVYAGASRYLIIGGLFVQALMLAIAPQISALLTTGDRRGARAVYQTVTVWAVMFTWPLYLALAVFSPLFLAILGQKFVVASTALTIGCFGVLVSMATGPISAVILMSGLSMWNLLNTIVGLGLNIGLSFWLIPSHGIDGAALASAISFSIYNFMGVAEIWFLLRLEPVGPGFGVVTAGATVCFGGLLLLARVLFGTDLPVFLVAGTIATLLYGVLILRFRHTLHLGALRDAMRARGLGRANGGPGEGSADGGRHRAKPRFDR
jgi:O-antigen/teichoic acid export membrane protein